tara:strand:- start:429 stop:947 length:519 start_codon:yes stop_codon:yes gene_type:complete
MKIEIIECTLVFLVPLLIACMINGFSKEKVRANMKVVYYKFFLLCIILFFASQVPIEMNDDSGLGVIIRILGDIFMALLVFEFFIVPSKDTHPDDVAIIHNSVLWLVCFIFLVTCCFKHYPEISDEEKGWNMHPIFGIFDIGKKLYNERAIPTNTSVPLPLCNIFSYVNKIE